MINVRGVKIYIGLVGESRKNEIPFSYEQNDMLIKASGLEDYFEDHQTSLIRTCNKKTEAC